MTKLKQLASIEDTSVDSLLESAVFGDECMGICKNLDCDYVVPVEPDSAEGWCEECNTNTVVSALQMALMI